MKLHRLELEGFGPFLERQVVDFDSFDGDGIFLITGRTGAGKSSILDGVAFALYGSVPRYEGGDKRIRSDHATPEDLTEVRLEFTVDDRRFIVTRSPDYDKPKKRGEGLTPVAHAARLDELRGSEWVTVAAKPRDVGHLLGDILGLTQQQFLQVILLAQNRFAQFLLAKNDERQALLRTLFGSRAYGDYQAALDLRRKDSEQSLMRRGDEVRRLLDEADLLIDEHDLLAHSAASAASASGAPDADGAVEVAGESSRGVDQPAHGVAADTATRIAHISRATERAAYRRDSLDRERDIADDVLVAATAAHSALTALRGRQVQRDLSRVALASLEEQEPAIAAERARHHRATEAEVLRASIDASIRARAACDRGVAAQIDAAAAWAAADEDDTTDAAALRLRIESMTGDLGRWSSVLEQEGELTTLAGLLDEARVAEGELVAELAALDERLAVFPTTLADLDHELAALATAAVDAETARGAADEIAARLAAAKDAEAKAEVMVAAERTHLTRSAELERSAASVTALLRRRLAGHAGELATALVDGEPCAVCGSLEHPQPAAHDDEPVTDEAIAQAETARDDASSTERAAAAAARAARTAHAEADGRAGGDGVAVLRALAIVAEEEKQSTRAAERRRAALVAERQTAVALQDEARTALVDVTARLADLRGTLAVATERAEAARAAVDHARGTFDSVEQRCADTRRRREIAQALASALEDAAGLAVRLAEAETDLDERISASEFHTVPDAVAALLDTATRAAIADRVRDHEVGLRSERDRLRDLELELAGHPEELVDLDVSAAAVAAARDELRSATEAATRAAAAADRLRGLGERADLARAESAELDAEHEVIAGLALALSGRTASRMDLETFVLAAELEEIIVAANLRLSEMSSGRYLLQHTDAVAARNAASGLGIEIVDAYTGRTRPAQSLSGGETFLASLALALGLAEVVTARAGGLRLDTLFIDEGFGSLDAETLELAMNTLDELRQGGRTVGVISHVEAMKDQLPAQLVVAASPQGPSTISQAAASPIVRPSARV